jgi:hypothetical protein
VPKRLNELPSTEADAIQTHPLHNEGLRERRISVRNAPVLDTPYARFYVAANPRFAEG